MSPRAGLDTAAVVEAAAAIADADGLQQLTLALLARRLGVRAPSLYAHVGGLDDLRARLGAHGAEQLTEAVTDEVAGRAGSDALHAAAHAYRRFAHAHPGLYEAMQRSPDNADSDGGRTAARLVAAWAAVMRGYGLQGDDAIHAIRVSRAALHGFVTLERDGGFRMEVAVQESFERLLEMLDRGLRPVRESPP